jgi:DNA-binding beta-propeller fold protein YncE
MIRIHISRHFLVAALAAWALLGSLPAVNADIPGTTPSETIDPSPGTDVFALQMLRLNHATHKIYVAGFPSDSTRNFGLKVIDATSFSVTAGIDLGRYSGSYNGFYPIGLDVDESAAPAGDKVYVIGRTDGSPNAILRVIDGPSNRNLTGENSGDLFLPVGLGGDEEFRSLVVNSANHKIYVAKANGEIVVVDGPNRQILKTLAPNFGDFLIANPAANKVFVVNHNGGGVINSADDTFAPLSLFFTATAAVLDSAHGRIYFVGRALNNSNAIYAIDAATGAIVGSKTDLPGALFSVAVDPGHNTLYVATQNGLLAYDTADLSPLKRNLAWLMSRLVCDPTATPRLFYLEDYQTTSRPNLLHALDPDSGLNGVRTDQALGYRPFDIAVNSRTNRIYATDQQTNEVLAIDRNVNGGITRIPVLSPSRLSNNPPWLDLIERHLAVSERLNRIYLPRVFQNILTGDISWSIDVLDGATNKYHHTFSLDPTVRNADHIAVDDTRRRIYISAARYNGTNFDVELLLLVYDADTEALITTVSLGKDFLSVLGGLAANPVTGRVYISAAGGVAIVDGNTNTKIGQVSAGGDIVINRRTNKIYAGGGNNTLAVINGGTDSLETTFPTPNQDHEYVVGFDVDEVTNRVYVTHAKEYALTGRMTAYDANNGYQFLGQIDLAGKPDHVACASAARQLFVSNDLDGVISVFQAATPAPADLFGNISTRAQVGAGDNALIGGFIIAGTHPKTVIVRGLGPSLPVAGALADPVIEVHGASGELIATNDNWKEAATKQQIIDSGLAPSSELESALWGTINPGAYTVVLRGKDNGTGIGLFEVYDLDLALPQKLANISTRGHVDSGDNVMIAGVIVMGSKPVQAVLRAIGPSLASAGVSNPLQDPVLELRDTNGGLITSNDDWQEHEAEVNGTSLAPTDPRESAIVTQLYPANYTAIVRGKNGATGVALVEAYHLTAGQ